MTTRKKKQSASLRVGSSLRVGTNNPLVTTDLFFSKIMVSTFFYKNKLRNKLRDPFILHHWSKLKKKRINSNN